MCGHQITFAESANSLDLNQHCYNVFHACMALICGNA